MKEFFKTIIIFFLVCGIVFFGYNIYSFIKGGNDNLIKIVQDSDNFNIVGSLVGNNVRLEDSGVSGSKFDFSSTYNPYYGTLNSYEKNVYKQVYANVLENKEVFVPVEDINVDQLVTILEAVLNDHPELFWLGNSFSYRYNSKNTVKQIILTYNGTQYDKDTFYKKADEILSLAKNYSTDYDKELFIHDYLVENVTYDEEAINNQSAYSALIGGKTVCAGYARAFQYLMNRLGIPTYYVAGTSEGEDHAWNIVKLSDGYYNVDVTWDDELHNTHALFNKTDEEFNRSHQRGELSNKIVKCTSSKYDFKNISNKREEEFVYVYE